MHRTNDADMDFAGRMTAVRRAMQQHRIDLLALPPGDDLRYLTGFSPLADERPCYLFLSAKAGAFLVPSLNADQAERCLRAMKCSAGSRATSS